MAFDSSASNQGPLFSIRYSAFLGSLYLHDDASRATLEAIKTEIGEDTVKQGFKGLGISTPSGIAMQKARKNGVQFGRMTGNLTGVRLLKREINGGREMPYLSVTLTDEEGKYNLSTSVAQKGAQMLIRKLYNADPGADSSINLFATFDQREGAARAYANHGASLRQRNAEVAGINPLEDLTPRVNAAIEALKAAGVDDQETINKRRSVVETDFHVDLLQQIEKRFATFYERETAEETRQPVPQSHGSGFEDMDDDIPF